MNDKQKGLAALTIVIVTALGAASYVSLTQPIDSIPPSDPLLTLYEACLDDDHRWRGVSGPTVWDAQTFTVSETHTLDKLVLSATVFMWPTADIIVSIRETDGNFPIGNDLTIATVSCTILTWGETWIEFDFPNILLEEGIYAFVIRVPEATQEAFPLFGVTMSGDIDEEYTYVGDYAGGTALVSEDAGNTWFTRVGIDYLFKEYGYPIN